MLTRESHVVLLFFFCNLLLILQKYLKCANGPYLIPTFSYLFKSFCTSLSQYWLVPFFRSIPQIYAANIFALHTLICATTKNTYCACNILQLSMSHRQQQCIGNKSTRVTHRTVNIFFEFECIRTFFVRTADARCLYIRLFIASVMLEQNWLLNHCVEAWEEIIFYSISALQMSGM